jgi:CheY-like chemotaxis protein
MNTMNKLKILAVDDEINILYCIASVLREYDVVYETLPMTAVQLLEEQHFDIIIADYQMPKVNGIELLEEAKKYSKNKQYTAIFCTAHGTTYLFKDEKEEGLFQFFLEKPFTTETLTKVVARAVTQLNKVCDNGT